MEGKELNELKNLITEMRICMAKMEANQKSFAESLTVFREERLKTYDIMTKKIDDLNEEIDNLDKKITYAAGGVMALSAMLSMLGSSILRKVGLV